jgi:four helix bundle protein
MSYGRLAVLEAAERAEDAINALIASSPRRLLHVAQMRDSAHAISSNIGEALGRRQAGDRRRSFEISRGETEETIRHLNVNYREGRITAKSYWPVHSLLRVISKMLSSLLA